jgi:aerobic carbon-monoxide dehydrogenase large subunit
MGRLRCLDVDAAREAEGVHLVLTAADLEAAGVRMDMRGERVKVKGGRGAGPVRPVLAQGRVRHVGEALAFIVADSLVAAKDAAELVVVDIDAEPAHLALAVGGPELHAEAPGTSRLIMRWAIWMAWRLRLPGLRGW